VTFGSHLPLTLSVIRTVILRSVQGYSALSWVHFTTSVLSTYTICPTAHKFSGWYTNKCPIPNRDR